MLEIGIPLAILFLAMLVVRKIAREQKMGDENKPQ